MPGETVERRTAHRLHPLAAAREIDDPRQDVLAVPAHDVTHAHDTSDFSAVAGGRSSAVSSFTASAGRSLSSGRKLKSAIDHTSSGSDATTLALRGSPSMTDSSPKYAPGPSVACVRPLADHLGVPGLDHEEAAAGRALLDDRPRPPGSASASRPPRSASGRPPTGRRRAARRRADPRRTVPPSFLPGWLSAEATDRIRRTIAAVTARLRAVPAVTAELLAAACARHLPGVTGVDAPTRLSGGASRETWSFDATRADGTVDRARAAARPGATIGSTDRSTEYELVRAAGRAGVAVPAVRFLLDADDDLGAGFVMDRIDGETIPRKLLRDEPYAAAREVMVAQCARAAAAIHAVPLGDLPRLAVQDAGHARRPVPRRHRHAGRTAPGVRARAALARRARRRLPDADAARWCTATSATGTSSSGPRASASVLDWELAHLGDPIEDLGWFCVKSWRFGNVDRRAGGFGTAEELLAVYADATGGTRRSRAPALLGGVRHPEVGRDLRDADVLATSTASSARSSSPRSAAGSPSRSGTCSSSSIPAPATEHARPDGPTAATATDVGDRARPADDHRARRLGARVPGTRRHGRPGPRRRSTRGSPARARDGRARARPRPAQAPAEHDRLAALARRRRHDPRAHRRARPAASAPARSPSTTGHARRDPRRRCGRSWRSTAPDYVHD